MKKMLIFSTILTVYSLLMVGAVSAQSLLNTSKTITQETTYTATDTTVGLPADIQNQPLHIRRQIVAGELAGIQERLMVLAEKTTLAAERLAKNNIDTAKAQETIAAAIISLTETKELITALTLSAHDPINETVTDVLIGDNSFKETVIIVEESLRNARQAIIDTLTALKLAVTTSVSTQ